MDTTFIAPRPRAAAPGKREQTKVQNREMILEAARRSSPSSATAPPRCATSSAPRRSPRARSTTTSSPRKRCTRRSATRSRSPSARAARRAAEGHDGGGVHLSHLPHLLRVRDATIEVNFRTIRHSADTTRVRMDTPEVIAGFEELREDIENGIARRRLSADRRRLSDGGHRRRRLRGRPSACCAARTATRRPPPTFATALFIGGIRTLPHVARSGRQDRHGMKAIVCRAICRRYRHADAGGRRRCRRWAPHEARVRVRAAAVNFPDILTVQGKYQHKPALPFTPGSEARRRRDRGRRRRDECEGGRSRDLRRRSAAIARGDAGRGRAACARSPAASTTPTPRQASPSPISPPMSRSCAARGSQAGEWLLVHGAAGGVGLAAVDLGKRSARKVIATASTRGEARFPERLRRRSRAAVVRLPRGGEGADRRRWRRCDLRSRRRRRVRRDRRAASPSTAASLIIGFTSGRIPSIGVNMPLIKGYLDHGRARRRIRPRFPEKGRENIAAIDKLLADAQSPLRMSTRAFRSRAPSTRCACSKIARRSAK